MRFPMWTTILLVAMALAPTASADVTTGGLLVVELDNTDASCGLGAAPCIMSLDSSGGPGETTLDLRQKYERIAIATNFSAIGLGGMLPVYAFVVDGDGAEVSYGVLELAMDEYARIPQERPARDAAGLTFDRREAGVYVYGPALADPTGPPVNKTYGMPTNGKYVAYDKIGPVNSGMVTTSDVQLSGTPAFFCMLTQQIPECKPLGEGAMQTYYDSTPNVLVGLEWEDVVVGTDPAVIADQVLDEPPALERPAAAPQTPEDGERTLAARPAGTREVDGERPVDHPLASSASPVSIERTRPPPEPRLAPLDDGSGDLAAAVRATVATIALVLAAAAAYSRFARDEEIAKSTPRQMILKLVQREGSVDLRRLPAALGVTRNAILYHVQRMERAALVRVVKEGSRTFVLPAASPADAEAVPRAFSTHPVSRAILARLTAAGAAGVTRAELHKLHPDLPRRTSNHVLAKLARSGIIVEQRAADEPRIRLAATLASAFTDHGGRAAP